jgi:hypothetical protein
MALPIVLENLLIVIGMSSVPAVCNVYDSCTVL